MNEIDQFRLISTRNQPRKGPRHRSLPHLVPLPFPSDSGTSIMAHNSFRDRSFTWQGGRLNPSKIPDRTQGVFSAVGAWMRSNTVAQTLALLTIHTLSLELRDGSTLSKTTDELPHMSNSTRAEANAIGGL